LENTHIDYTWYDQVKNKTNDTEDHGKEVGFLGKENCLKYIKEINPQYVFSYEDGAVDDDILVCQIKKLSE